MGNLNNKNKYNNKKENKKNNNIENNIQNNNNYLFHSNPSDINFLKDLTTESYCMYWNDNTFTLFKSYNGIFYIIYTNIIYSIF